MNIHARYNLSELASLLWFTLQAVMLTAVVVMFLNKKNIVAFIVLNSQIC